ncbi:MAG: glycosyltransferase family 2 protein [Candidatus Lactobacillus pullistercoris]|uniref:Glycosyltransferase family 2 protein n=1 Tax=Candidatus Lactobacillus pullistercoris TaxID=2838636 RepID=A0A9E2KRK0_9LACO|nr:glycosyltransferase family 2 protein [Candidatus Lactobacillus pullistercoris]
MTPFFSIIVPVYQSEKFLLKSIKNLREQTFEKIEIILVDDASTDNSLKLCQKISKEDSRVIVIHHTKNMGASRARNSGIEIAHGKWIIFVDSDDLVSVEMCRSFYDYIKCDPSLDFVACNFVSRKNDLFKKVLTNNVVLKLENKDQNINLIKQMLLSDYRKAPQKFQNSFGNNVILNSPWAKAYNKSFLDKNNIKFQTNIKYSEDLLFNIEILACQAKGIYVNNYIYFYRNNSNSITHQNYLPQIIENYFYWNQLAQNFFKHKNLNSLIPVLQAYIFSNVLLVIPRDIFRPNNSFYQSYCRMRQVNKSLKFKDLCNTKIRKSISSLLSNKTKIRSELLLKNHFLILYLKYKVLENI